jgi:hypothetical protein
MQIDPPEAEWMSLGSVILKIELNKFNKHQKCATRNPIRATRNP